MLAKCCSHLRRLIRHTSLSPFQLYGSSEAVRKKQKEFFSRLIILYIGGLWYSSGISFFWFSLWMQKQNKTKCGDFSWSFQSADTEREYINTCSALVAKMLGSFTRPVMGSLNVICSRVIWFQSISFCTQDLDSHVSFYPWSFGLLH